MFHVLLLHYAAKPNPDYPNLAAGLRARGHTVWRGVQNRDGGMEWHDGQQVVGYQRGPAGTPAALSRVPLVGLIADRLLLLGFMLRLALFLRRVRPDFVQVNPANLKWLAVLPLAGRRETRFIFNVKQINLGWHKGWLGRIRDWQMLQAYRITARHFYDHSCFDYPASARRVLGDQWPRWATSIPVGLDPGFLDLRLPTASASPANHYQVRFIYLGALTRSRELERPLLAVEKLRDLAGRFQVDFFGPDKADGFYQEMAERLGLAGLVAFKAPVPNERIPALLASYDVGLAYVLDRVGFHLQPAIKLLEYRAVGLPILATDLECNHGVVENGINGLLVPASIEGLAEGIRRFVEDRDLLENCREKARAMRQGITRDQVAEMYEQQVYCRLRQQESRGAGPVRPAWE